MNRARRRTRHYRVKTGPVRAQVEGGHRYPVRLYNSHGRPVARGHGAYGVLMFPIVYGEGNGELTLRYVS